MDDPANLLDVLKAAGPLGPLALIVWAELRLAPYARAALAYLRALADRAGVTGAELARHAAPPAELARFAAPAAPAGAPRPGA